MFASSVIGERPNANQSPAIIVVTRINSEKTFSRPSDVIAVGWVAVK